MYKYQYEHVPVIPTLRVHAGPTLHSHFARLPCERAHTHTHTWNESETEEEQEVGSEDRPPLGCLTVRAANAQLDNRPAPLTLNLIRTSRPAEATIALLF